MNPIARLIQRLKGPPTCQKVNRFLADYLEESLPPDTRLQFQTHLNTCPRCLEYLNQYKATIDLMKVARDVPIPDRLAEHTLQFLRSNADFSDPES